MDIEIWGFDHGVVHVLSLPGSVMVLVGSLYLCHLQEPTKT